MSTCSAGRAAGLRRACGGGRAPWWAKAARSPLGPSAPRRWWGFGVVRAVSWATLRAVAGARPRLCETRAALPWRAALVLYHALIRCIRRVSTWFCGVGITELQHDRLAPPQQGAHSALEAARGVQGQHVKGRRSCRRALAYRLAHLGGAALLAPSPPRASKITSGGTSQVNACLPRALSRSPVRRGSALAGRATQPAAAPCALAPRSYYRPVCHIQCRIRVARSTWHAPDWLRSEPSMTRVRLTWTWNHKFPLVQEAGCA